MGKWKDILDHFDAEGAATVDAGIGRDAAELIDQALQVGFSEEEIQVIIDEARGDGPEGFAERLAGAIESRVEVDPATNDIDPVTPGDAGDLPVSTAQADMNAYENAKDAYDSIKEQYLFRNVFVSSARLEMDIEAYKTGMPGANGKPVTGGDIAMDVVNLLRGNIFESIIEVAIRDYFDEKYPGVTAEVDHVEAADVTDISEQGESDPLIMDEKGVIRDDGYVYDLSAFKSAGVDIETARKDNPTYGQYLGADMMREPKYRDGMKIWEIGKYENLSAVVGGNVERLGIPPVRLVELHDNHYHVDPFGKILSADTERNPNSVLEPGSRLSSLDVSAFRGNGDRMEALAANRSVSVEELKADISEKTQADFVDFISSRADGHAAYLRETALPETRGELADYRSDMDTVEQRIGTLTQEKQSIEANPELTDSDRERLQQIGAELEKAEDYKESLQQAIDKAESRVDGMERNLEVYDQAKEKLAVENGDPAGRFAAVVDLESAAAGRADTVIYMDPEKDKEIAAYSADIRSAQEQPADVDRDSHAEGNAAAKDVDKESVTVEPEEGDTARDNPAADTAQGEEGRGDTVDREQADGSKPDLPADQTDIPVDVPANDSGDKSPDVENADEREPQSRQDVGVVEPRSEDEGEHIERVGTDTPGENDVESAGAGETAQEKDGTVVQENEPDSQITSEGTEHSSTGGDSPLNNSVESDHPASLAALSAVDSDVVDTQQESDVSRHTPVTTTAQSDKDDDAAAVAEMQAVLESINESSGVDGRGLAPADSEGGATERESDDTEKLYNDVLEAFERYIDDGTFSLTEDFFSGLSDEDIMTLASGDILQIAFAELYENTPTIDRTDGASFGDLLYEVALFQDGSMMQNIDNILDYMRENGVSADEAEVFLGVVSEDVVARMSEEMAISHDDGTGLIIRLGEEGYYLTPEGVTNAMDGTQGDPEGLIDHMVDFIDEKFGGDISQAARESLSVDLGDTPLLQAIDLLDSFFDGFADTVSDALLDMAHMEDVVEARQDDLTADMNREEQERIRDAADGHLDNDSFTRDVLGGEDHFQDGREDPVDTGEMDID